MGDLLSAAPGSRPVGQCFLGGRFVDAQAAVRQAEARRRDEAEALAHDMLSMGHNASRLFRGFTIRSVQSEENGETYRPEWFVLLDEAEIELPQFRSDESLRMGEPILALIFDGLAEDLLVGLGQELLADDDERTLLFAQKINVA